jgi:hypothetical protein
VEEHSIHESEVPAKNIMLHGLTFQSSRNKIMSGQYKQSQIPASDY